MIKKLVISALIAASTQAVAAAELPIDIKVNGAYLLCDSPPYIEGDLSFAPIRAVSEALGAEVEWNNDERSANVYYENTVVKLYTDKDIVIKDGVKIEANAGLNIKNDRTMVPVRLLSELLGAEVTWDNTYRNVIITKDDADIDEENTDNTYTDDDVYWMSRIIDAEACGESYVGKLAVGEVILNRKDSHEFPNTLYGVIFDKKHGVQFEPILNGSIYNTPCPDSVAAAKTVLREKTNHVGDSLYFFAPKIAQSNWISNNRVHYKTIGNHEFYL